MVSFQDQQCPSRWSLLIMATVTLVGFGLGNIQAFANIYHRLNIPVVIASNANQLLGAEKLILPGVGAFDWAMSRLNESGMRTRLDELVLHQKIPVLGVCVGMQMMANQSEEGKLAGLGWIEAEVVRFQAEQINSAPLPHMGWNDVRFSRDNPLSKGIENPRFYFLHSYHFIAHQNSQILATTEYGISFTSIVSKENIWGVQFHPEKSHNWGVQLLKNFAEN